MKLEHDYRLSTNDIINIRDGLTELIAHRHYHSKSIEWLSKSDKCRETRSEVLALNSILKNDLIKLS